LFFRFGSVTSFNVGPGTVDGSFGLLAVALRRLGFDESAIVSAVVIFLRLGGLSSNF
jgi:hypothetical protein